MWLRFDNVCGDIENFNEDGKWIKKNILWHLKF